MELVPYDDHVITQVATGLFGVREETIQRGHRSWNLNMPRGPNRAWADTFWVTR